MLTEPRLRGLAMILQLKHYDYLNIESFNTKSTRHHVCSKTSKGIPRDYLS